MASAWLIRRFIDRAATFAFAGTPASTDVAFDTYSGEFSHHGGLCTFEVLTNRFNIAHPAVTRLAQIVHDLDLKEARYSTLEAPAVERMVGNAWSRACERCTQMTPCCQMFEALARSFESSTAVERSPRFRSRRKK